MLKHAPMVHAINDLRAGGLAALRLGSLDFWTFGLLDASVLQRGAWREGGCGPCQRVINLCKKRTLRR